MHAVSKQWLSVLAPWCTTLLRLSLLLVLIGCNDWRRSPDVQTLPVYPHADMETRSPWVPCADPQCHGSVRHITFQTPDLPTNVLAFYERALLQDQWRTIDPIPNGIALIYPNGCPFYATSITAIRSTNDVTTVAIRLVREGCR